MTDIRPAQRWKKSDREVITVQEVTDVTVAGSLYDTVAGSSAAWVGSPKDFDSLELIFDPQDE